MHLPIRKVAAKQRFRGRRFIRRLDPAKAVTPAIVRSDDPLPSALPNSDALSMCPLCGMPNGITAKVCWRCDADLSMPAAPSSDVDQQVGAKEPEGFDQVPGTDNQGAQDAAVEPPGGDVGDSPGTALADPTGPVALSDLPRIAGVRSGYPTLTQVVQNARPLTTLPAFAAAQQRPKRDVVVPAVVAVLAILVAGAYLYANTPSGLDASWSRTTTGRQNEPAVAPAAVEPAITERTNSPSTPVALDQDATPKIGEPRAGGRARSGKPAEAADVKAPPPAIARASDKDFNMAPSSAMPSANVAAATASQRDRVRAASRSANAGAAVQRPGTLERPRQAPEPRVPCTAAVTALGLCEPP